MLKSIAAAPALLALSAISASAQAYGDQASRPSWWHPRWDFFNPTLPDSPAHNVPEIDASSGLLAMAAVLAALLLTWEIKRRRS
ncbi:VPEID-CTERM sorting domain-containing protein [Roseovarius sp. M141]|uniref:VPEID-CTERM sorting domain-containing protein n=1 Tax=Roseovarius sp. M141 TaxID=2583806 RepID=UPI0020CD3B24|nr:VPEID-CTERM sorting domain-containing protein [Roseovarius sp. M141]